MKSFLYPLSVLVLIFLSTCTKSPKDFPEEDVFVTESGSFFVNNGNGKYTRYSPKGEVVSDEWREIDIQDQWILIAIGNVKVALPRDKDPKKFLISTALNPEWQEYGRMSYAKAKNNTEDFDNDEGNSSEEKNSNLSASDYGLTYGVLPSNGDIYLKASNGDELHVWFYQVGDNPSFMANNLEGWVFQCSDKTLIREGEGGDYWAIGGRTYVTGTYIQDRPILFIAKDWSWIQVNNIEGTFNQYITKQEYEQKSKKLQAEIRARGEKPRNPMAIIIDQATKYVDTQSQVLANEIKAAADAPYTSSCSSSQKTTETRQYVRVKEYSPNYTGSNEQVYCKECGGMDFPHIHYNKTY